MITTAYENYLVKIASKVGGTDNYQIGTISIMLKEDCADGNPQAFDIVGRTEDKSFTGETFIKAAKQVWNNIKGK